MSPLTSLEREGNGIWGDFVYITNHPLKRGRKLETQKGNLKHKGKSQELCPCPRGGIEYASTFIATKGKILKGDDRDRQPACDFSLVPPSLSPTFFNPKLFLPIIRDLHLERDCLGEAYFWELVLT